MAERTHSTLPFAIGWTFFFSGFSKMHGVPLSWHRRQGALNVNTVRCGERWTRGPEPGRAEGADQLGQYGTGDSGRAKAWQWHSRLLRTDSCLSCTPCTLARRAWGCAPGEFAALAGTAAGPRRCCGSCLPRLWQDCWKRTTSGWAGRWCGVACCLRGSCRCCRWATSTCRRTETRSPSALLAISNRDLLRRFRSQTVGRRAHCNPSPLRST
jgi:hypothetical protein